MGPASHPAFELSHGHAEADGDAERDEASPLLLQAHDVPQQGQRDNSDVECATTPFPMTSPPPRSRLHYLDYLRVFLTASVLVHHCFYIFWLGWWPYYGYWLLDASEAIAGPSWSLLSFNQAYFMGLFFFLAGHFSAPSLQRKGTSAFLTDRATRLLLPAVFFETLLAPLACSIARGANPFDIPPGLDSAPSTFTWYWSQYNGFGANPTWFIFLLFFFDCTHAAWHSRHRLLPFPANPKPASDSTPSLQPSNPAPFSVSSTLTALGCTAAALTAGCFLTRTSFPIGYWLPWGFPGLQLAYLPQYLPAYLLGTAAHRSNALARLPASAGPWLLLASLTSFTISWIGVLVVTGVNARAGMPNPAAPLQGSWGGWALYYAATEQTFAVCWSTGLLVTARQHCNLPPGRRWAAVIGAAYAAYLLHPIVVYCLTRALTDPGVWRVTGGSILMHVLVECPLVVVLSWGVALGVKAIPGAGRVL